MLTIWWNMAYYEEFPFCLYSHNIQNCKKGMKPIENKPTTGINTDKLFTTVPGDCMPLGDSCTSVSTCASKARLLTLQISIGQ